MGVSGKTSRVSSIIAAFCILIYIAATAFGVVRIITSAGERRNLASVEFEYLKDRASQSAQLRGFMSGEFQENVMDFLSASETLLAVIITGPNGEYAFERFPGSGIVWAGNSPRFKTRPVFSPEPFYYPLRVEGQRNVTIQAVHSVIDSRVFLSALRNTLLAVLIALSIAFVTLIVELNMKNRGYKAASPDKPGAEPGPAARGAAEEDGPESTLPDSLFFSGGPEEADGFSTGTGGQDGEEETGIPVEIPLVDFEDDFSGFDDDDSSGPEEEPAPEKEDAHTAGSPGGEQPQGLFTPRGNIGWKSYTQDRLASELHRCASFEQDLVFMDMEFRGKENISDSLYRQFADEAVAFFGMRDLIFEEGVKGISVIVPSTDLEQGITKSEEFRAWINAKLPESFEGRTGLCIGLSARSGRLIEAGRLMLEASTALKKALEDPIAPVVGFKSDLEKYREFIKRSGKP